MSGSSATVRIDGQLFELGDAATKMVRWLIRLNDDIENRPVVTLVLKRSQDKVAAELHESRGVDRGDRTLAEIGGG